MNRETISSGLAFVALALAFIASAIASDGLPVLITIAAGCLLAIVASVILK
jgi:hypothetical protein